MFRPISCLCVLFLSCSTAAYSETINIGLLGFDVLTPPNGAGPGVNVFTIINLTGDPILSGFALPPDFPVYAATVLLGATLMLDDGRPPVVVDLGAIDPGLFPSPGSLQFPDTFAFTSAMFAATLNQTSFLLADGTTFVAHRSAVLATLLPFVGPSLVAGSDFAVISIAGSSATTSAVPEPRTAVLVLVAFVLFSVVSTARRTS